MDKPRTANKNKFKKICMLLKNFYFMNILRAANKKGLEKNLQ